MLRCEFHSHTVYSKDSLTQPEKILAACQRKGIQRIAITDHNTIQGGLHARSLDPEHVIVGEEIMTTQGELLAFFVEEEIPHGLSPQETIQRLRGQEAFISVSHPFDRMRKGAWKEADLLEILPLIDAIEIFNSRCISPESNRLAQDFARQHDLASTVGSDAHVIFEIGRATMLLPEFHDAQGLQAVIRQGEPRVSLSSPWVHLTSRYASWYKKLKSRR
jgi:predicted metal-dependent phosphoesterase TrpH